MRKERRVMQGHQMQSDLRNTPLKEQNDMS
jgi:hypothetical protein